LKLVELAALYDASLTWIFASPTSGNTPYLGLSEMRALGPSVQRMLLRASELGVKCSPDLPIALCIFDPEFLKENAENFALIKQCQPFAYFHVDGKVSYCTAMPIYTSGPPSTSDELANIIKQHRQSDATLKQKPSFPDCVTCEQHLVHICQGGCMTYKVYGNIGSENAQY
jgi:radical SAM protein with 4Fe4S-binding SPASM domain